MASELTEKEQDKIEAYLSEQMNSEERISFENELLSNKKLKEYLDIQESLQKAVNDNHYNSLRENLQDIVDSKQLEDNVNIKPPRWPAIIFLLSLLTIIFLVFIFTSKDQLPSSTEPQKNVPLTKEESSESQEFSQEEEIKTNVPIEKNQAAKPVRKQKEYASVDYSVNQDLEYLIGSNMRSNKTLISVEQGIIDILLNSENESSLISLSGTFSSEGGTEGLIFKLFSNNRDSFEQDQYLFKDSIQIKKSFVWQRNTLLKPGLYYYTIEDENEEILYINKFEVRIKN